MHSDTVSTSNLLEKGKAQAARATLKDVALRAGVTVGGASRVINGSRSGSRLGTEATERVRRAAAELGYVANPHAQKLKGGRSHNLIQIFSLYPLMSPVSTIIGSIQRELREAGYDAPFHGYANFSECGVAGAVNQVSLLRDLRRSKPRAIVCHMSGLEEESLEELRAFQEEGGVLVTFDHGCALECDQVIVSEEEGQYQAARHLLELGHRRLGLYLTLPTDPTPRQYRGFERALSEYGVAVNQEWMFSGVWPPSQGGIELAHKFLSLSASDRPTGMCVLNDMAAFGFVAKVKAAGLQVPEDVSVVGHGDEEFAGLIEPPLTTISFPIHAVVFQVLRLLHAQLKDSPSPSQQRVPVPRELVLRQSTKLNSATPR